MAERKSFQIRTDEKPASAQKGPTSAGALPADKAAPPFATRDGAPKTRDNAPGLDFLKEPTGHGDKTPPRDYVSTSDRKQQQPPAQQTPPRDPVARGNRPQTPGTLAQRLGGVSASNLPADGPGIPMALTPPQSRDAGSVGNARRPFKLKQ
jgi:hypothetical protein